MLLNTLIDGTFGKKAKCVMDGKNGEGNIAGVVLIEDKVGLSFKMNV